MLHAIERWIWKWMLIKEHKMNIRTYGYIYDHMNDDPEFQKMLLFMMGVEYKALRKLRKL